MRRAAGTGIAVTSRRNEPRRVAVPTRRHEESIMSHKGTNHTKLRRPRSRLTYFAAFGLLVLFVLDVAFGFRLRRGGPPA